MTEGGFLRIGELARRAGLTQRTLRHYDDIGLLKPSGRSWADYRLYSRADVGRLLAISQLKSLGLSLAEIGQALDEGTEPAELLARHAELLERRIAAEQELLARLRFLQRTDDADWDEVLESIELAERLHHPDAAVRFGAALDGSGRAPVDELIALLTDKDPSVREGATWALTHRDGVLPRLVDALGSGPPEARHALAHVLGKLRDPAGTPHLIHLLGDADERTAAKAAFSLGQLGGPEAVTALVGALGDDRVRVRDEATLAVARVEGARAPLEQATQDCSALVREHAAEALGILGDPASVPALAAALTDDSAAVRFAALVGLGDLPGDDAGRAIEGCVDSPDERARTLAIRLLTDRQA